MAKLNLSTMSYFLPTFFFIFSYFHLQQKFCSSFPVHFPPAPRRTTGMGIISPHEPEKPQHQPESMKDDQTETHERKRFKNLRVSRSVQKPDCAGCLRHPAPGHHLPLLEEAAFFTWAHDQTMCIKPCQINIRSLYPRLVYRLQFAAAALQCEKVAAEEYALDLINRINKTNDSKYLPALMQTAINQTCQPLGLFEFL